MQVGAAHSREPHLENQPSLNCLSQLNCHFVCKIENAEDLSRVESVGLTSQPLELFVWDIEDLLRGGGMENQEEKAQVVNQRPDKFTNITSRPNQAVCKNKRSPCIALRD